MSSSMIFDYERAFIRRAHQLLIWGYQAARRSFDLDTEEEVISQFICAKIRYLVREDPRLPEEYHRYYVHWEVLVSNTGRTGKRRKRIDIVVDTSDPRSHPEFICEAKRLRTGSYYVSEYAGKEGMLCFINEEYATDYSFAAMLGYMQSDGANHWFSKLKEHLEDPKQTILQMNAPLTPCKIIDDLPEEWTSEHIRTTRSPILLYHIFLDCA